MKKWRDEKFFCLVKKKNEIIENKFGKNFLLLNQTKMTLKETSEKKEKEKKKDNFLDEAGWIAKRKRQKVM